MGLAWIMVSLGLPISSSFHLLDPTTAWGFSGLAAMMALWCARKVWRAVKTSLLIALLGGGLGLGFYCVGSDHWSAISKTGPS